ncbi:hypothetical protein KAURM247S_05013 [Kitasatospora aureofaciens]
MSQQAPHERDLVNIGTIGLVHRYSIVIDLEMSFRL